MPNVQKKPVNPNNKKPAAGGQPTKPAPQIDLTGLVELASKLTEYYGGGAGQGYKVERRKNPDGSMELVIAPVSGDKRTFTITYSGQPDAQGFVQGTLKVDDKNSVAVRFHPRLGKNYLTEEDAKKLAEFLTVGTSNKEDTKQQDTSNNAGVGGNEEKNNTFRFFDPFQQPELLNLNLPTNTNATERTPGFWEKLSDSLANSLPFLITVLLMRSNRSEE